MKNSVHLICNAHLDPVWQWRWMEGCSEAMATFRNAVEIIDEYPELIFNHNEAILYQWVQRYDPPLFKRIQDCVEAGRWHIAGGWFLQPDLNLLPIGNLRRHIEFGQKYFKEQFGATPKVAYNFDSFGHPGTLPKLLREYGYEMYIHQRPEKEFLNLPDSLYQWKGLDGTTIPAYRIEIGLYHSERKNIQQRLEEATQKATELNRDVALFWGLGNHGGGATRKDLDHIRAYCARDLPVEIIHSTTDRFFEAVQPLLPSIPIFEGSLQRVFTGCYTSLSRVKRKALEVSGAAEQAEGLAAAQGIVRLYDAHLPLAKGYHQELQGIWEDILFNDFHDILPGTCTEPAEQDALNLYGRAMENIHRLNLQSITTINQEAEPLASHIPVTVYQSDPKLIDFPLEFECMSDYRPFWDGDRELVLLDREGTKISSQEEQAEARLPFFRWRRKIVCMAHGWGAGVRHLKLEPGEESGSHGDGETGRKVEGMRGISQIDFEVVEDLGDSWGTDQWSWNKIVGHFEIVIEDRIIESGPIRTIYESVWGFRHSKITLQRLEYTEWPVTEYRIRVQWNEERMRLKIAIDSGSKDATLKAEIPGGWENIPNDGQEYVHGRWMVLSVPATTDPTISSSPSESKSLTIAHNGLHGFDFKDGVVRFSALRSAAYCHEQGYDLNNKRSHKFMDIGNHDIKLAIHSVTEHKNPDRTIAPESLAMWLIAPPLTWSHLPVGSFK